MAKENSYSFSIKDFIKYTMRHWIMLILCLVVGGAVSAYSWKGHSLNYVNNITILVHDETDSSSDDDEYAQLVDVLMSKEVYLNIGLDEADIQLEGVTAQALSTGVIKLIVQADSEAKVEEKTNFVIDNSEKVLDSVFVNNHFKTTVLSKDDNSVVTGTKKEKVFSVVVIMTCSVIVLCAINFLRFRKIVK